LAPERTSRRFVRLPRGPSRAGNKPPGRGAHPIRAPKACRSRALRLGGSCPRPCPSAPTAPRRELLRLLCGRTSSASRQWRLGR
jgi:hypothetical protein